MSRSHRAWTESCALVRAAVRGAGKLGKLEVQAHLGHEERLPGTAPSLTRLRWLTATAVLVLAFGPAVSLGRASSGSPHSQPSAIQVPQSPLQAHDATRSGARSSDPSHARRLPARGGIVSAQLFAPGSGEHSLDGSAVVRVLQRRLVQADYALGPVDGRYGPRTEQAVRRFQAAYGLQVDGIAGPQTLAALSARTLVIYPGAGSEPGGSGPVRVLQRRLASAGFAPGPVDGRYGPRTERAVRRFQAAYGLQVDGIAGPGTFARLRAQRRSEPRPHARSRKPAGAPVPRNARRASHPAGMSSIAWLVLVAPLALGLLLVLVTRRGRRRGVGAWVRSPQPPNGPQQQEVLGNGAQQPDRGAQEAHVAVWAVTQGAPRGEPAGAQAASQLADQRNDADDVFNLGVLLEEQSDLAGALTAYRRADERGHGPAASNLGVLLEEQGDLVGAEAAYRRADQRNDANGAFNLGVLLEEQGDLAGALTAYRRADERGHGPAASNLGVLLEEQGDLVGAEAAYRRADQRNDANGAFNLGVLLEEQGDLAGHGR